ncbi:MAG TPA: hypothetical protein VHY79_15595 [Rhizomicrobium sp.]|nr:hypothetical protein [Rhizomicrobium sp.]
MGKCGRHSLYFVISLYTEPESISSAGDWITGSWNEDQPGSHGFLRSP